MFVVRAAADGGEFLGPIDMVSATSPRIEPSIATPIMKPRILHRLPWFVLLVFGVPTRMPVVLAAPPTVSAWWDLQNWAIEQMPGGIVKSDSGRLVIDVADGCTVWWRAELRAPVRIAYDATVVSAGGAHDRVSDLNCFWMAQESETSQAPFASTKRRGRFSDYDSLVTYYVGYGGNGNSTTRFRRYDRGQRPLLAEHDLRERRFLLEPNRRYHVELVAADGKAEFFRDGEKIFSFADPHPLTRGWFAFRTVHSHLIIENFRIETAR